MATAALCMPVTPAPPARMLVPETPPSAPRLPVAPVPDARDVERDQLVNDTCGLINDVHAQEQRDPVRDYVYAIDKYGGFEQMGSVNLIDHLRLKVTTIEARIHGERDDSARDAKWRTELDFLNGVRTEPAYLDDVDDCIERYKRGAWQHDAQYGGYTAALAADGCTNPIMLFNRAKDKFGVDSGAARMHWQLQAFLADQVKSRDELQRKIAFQKKRCLGAFDVVLTNTTDLHWRRLRTGTELTAEPSDQRIAEERACVLASNKRAREDSMGGTSKRRAVSTGGGAMPFIKGSKRAITKDVRNKRPAPTHRQEPVHGTIPFRTDVVEHNSIGERECVVEALRAALGTNRLTRASLGLPAKGDANIKVAVQALKQTTPFRLRKSPPVSWSGLLQKPSGIYIGRALLKDGSPHYMVYDAWRHIIFVGGGPAPPEEDPIERLLLEDDDQNEDVPDAPHVGRSWFVEDHELQDPSKFQDYMCKTLNVCGGIDGIYRVDIIAARARDTSYNTPEHYD